MINKLANTSNSDSLAMRLRRKRFEFFWGLLGQLRPPIKLLDIGGKEKFWKSMDIDNFDDINITIINIEFQKVTLPNFISKIGDARHMPEYQDNEFDVVFSNSVIEHLVNYENQKRMAYEVSRVGKRYFVQTPNRYFPIEPHFHFPFFQFLPMRTRIWLQMHRNLGWRKKIIDYELAKKSVEEVRLLTKRELSQLFPHAQIYNEVYLGLTKSFIVHYGWDS
jgi:ubiquinone/menaquinone biosynthesis C-methylase UbiE